MSVHYEWINARTASVTYVPPRHYVDGSPIHVDDEPSAYHYDNATDVGAIVLSSDDAVVIEGTRDQLRALAERMLAAIIGQDTHQNTAP